MCYKNGWKTLRQQEQNKETNNKICIANIMIKRDIPLIDINA